MAEEYVLNPQVLEKKKKYIWFNRNEAYRKDIFNIFKLFLFYEIYVDGFASDSCNDIGLTIFNKEIVDISTLDENDAIVFANSEINYSICCPVKICIDKKGPRSTVQYKYSDCAEGYQLSTGTFLRVYRIAEMVRLLSEKSVFIYGTCTEARRFATYLRLLDFRFKGFFDDFDNIQEEEIEGFPVRCIEDFLYENKGFVVIAGGNIAKSIKKMGELGYQYILDFVLAEPFALHYLFVRKNALDINLGNTYVGTSKYPGLRLPERKIMPQYPGFCIYGVWKEDSYKIVVLGGSTTDGNLFGFKSWPEILFELIDNENITIFNGGVAGYTSGHELFKFIRDVLPMKPDMVIVFDGYNDTCQGRAIHPFSFTYAKEIFDYGASHVADEYVKQQISSETCEGVLVKRTRFDNWISNIEILNNIAESKNIKFYSFLQPMLMSKIRNEREDNIYLSSRQFYEKELYSMVSFREEMGNVKIKRQHEYMYDLSDIFDDQPDVYMDICHVCEKGNQIIADAVYDVIKNQLKNA